MGLKKFCAGQLIVYRNGDNFEIGKIKRLTEDGAFVYYSAGETAAKTSFLDMFPIRNAYLIEKTALGGMGPKAGE